MHEMAFISRILAVAEREAKKNGAEKVLAVNITLGAYSDVVPKILREYFAIAAAGSIAEGAKINICRTDPVISCRKCGFSGGVEKGVFACPECGSSDISLLQGTQFRIDSLEVT